LEAFAWGAHQGAKAKRWKSRALGNSEESRKWRSPRGLRHSCLSATTCRPRSSAQQLHRSVLPLDPVARVARACAHPQRPPGQHEVAINEAPRHQPVRLESRSNQRLYVPFGSPPSVAVGFSTARAAHQSRAHEVVIPNFACKQVRNSDRALRQGIYFPQSLGARGLGEAVRAVRPGARR
jgi:hypothetical protein